MATQKQVNYALYLLGEAGFDTRYMGAAFKKLGANMRERSGSLEGWLKGMSTYEASQVIQTLLDKDY